MKDIPSAGVIVVRVEVGVLVVLDTVVIPADAEIQSERARCTPGILQVAAEFVIAVTPAKGRRRCRQSDAALWRDGSRIPEVIARQLALRIHRYLELTEHAIKEPVHACTKIGGA